MNAQLSPATGTETIQLALALKKTLTLGEPMDARHRQWRLPNSVAPEQRLAFVLAVHFTGGSFVMTCADRGFLCAQLVSQRFAELTRARKGGSYEIGFAFARLHEALGFAHDETIGFSLIEHSDLSCPEGFIKGFADSIRLSMEADVMRVLTGSKATNATLVANLRHFVDDHATVCALGHEVCASCR